MSGPSNHAGGLTSRTGRFSDEVEKALQEVLPSTDELDSPDFDPVAYVNARFATERSLDGLDGFIAEVHRDLSRTEGRLLEAVKVQATTATSAARDLQQAKGAVMQLHERVSDIKSKAEASERMVASICDGIRHLDTAKQNLSTSIKTLRNLQLYIISLQTLASAYEAKDYTRCNDSLRSSQLYRTKFLPFAEAPKIRELSEKLSSLERQLEFHLRNHAIGDMRPGQNALTQDQLREACLIVDALGPEVQTKVRAKFIATQLEPYGTLFRRGTEDAALERTERRFAFIRKLLDSNERFFLNVFPRHWCVAQELCVEFCLRTNKELTHQLRDEAASVDVAVLVFILQKTIEVEKDLTQRMRRLQAEIDDDDDNLEFEPVAHSASNKPPLPEYRYYGLIVRCFDAHMDSYVQHEDRMLDRTIAECVEGDSVAEDQITLQSSQDLFLFIQESKRRAATFSQPSTIADLAAVWLKHLVRYAELVGSRVSAVPTSDAQLSHYCVVINSADYCRTAADGLCEDLTKLLEGDNSSVKHLYEEVTEAFIKLSSKANTNLVEAINTRLNQHVQELQTFLFSTLASGSDHAHAAMDALDESPMSLAMRRTYRDFVTLCARTLHPHCFPYVLNKTAATFIPKSWSRLVYNPKGRHTDITISQLRLECTALDKWLQSTPLDVISAPHSTTTNSAGVGGGGSIARGSVLGAAKTSGSGAAGGGDGGDAPRVVLTAYKRTVQREISYLQAALKVLQLPAGDAFVELYYVVTPAERRSLADCAKLLELKGVKPDDQRQLLALLRRHADVPKDDTLAEPLSKANTSGGPPAATAPGAGALSSSGPQPSIVSPNNAKSPQSRFGNFFPGGQQTGNNNNGNGGNHAAAGAATTITTSGTFNDEEGTIRRKFRDVTARFKQGVLKDTN